MWVSAYNTSIGVALYAPTMTRKHLFCMTSSLLLDSILAFFLASAGICHAIEPCAMAGRITAIYKSGLGSQQTLSLISPYLNSPLTSPPLSTLIFI